MLNTCKQASHRPANDHTPRISILDLVSVCWKPGKGTMHAYTVTQRKKNYIKEWEHKPCFSYYMFYVFYFGVLPACPSGVGRWYLGQLSQLFHLPTPCQSTHPDVVAGKYKMEASEELQHRHNRPLTKCGPAPSPIPSMT